MKKIVFLLAFTVNFMVGGAFAAVAGIPPVIGGLFVNGIATLSPLFSVEGLRAGIYTEVWTGEMIKQFRTSMESIGWINKIRSYDQYAQNDLIHFVDIGGDPDVLINDTTRPIPVQALTDQDKAISLDLYQTKATVITDDELYAISYDKMASVLERHKASILEKKYSRSLYSLAPNIDGAGTPVLLTTGANSPDGSRKMLLRTDIIQLKTAFDKLKVPVQGRILVLCNDHVSDLLANDQKFADQYYNYSTGKIANMYGFELYEYNDSPYYTVSTTAKLTYGAVPTATERQSSVAFYYPRMMKATGTTLAYLSEAKSNPTTQENLLNFRHYFICLPLKNEAIGAVVSDI
jgi:hypothetical protein